MYVWLWMAVERAVWYPGRAQDTTPHRIPKIFCCNWWTAESFSNEKLCFSITDLLGPIDRNRKGLKHGDDQFILYGSLTDFTTLTQSIPAKIQRIFVFKMSVSEPLRLKNVCCSWMVTYNTRQEMQKWNNIWNSIIKTHRGFVIKISVM
jgi:hypothetical protein